MSMNFADGSDAGSSELIPDGQLAWAFVSVRGMNRSKEPNKETGRHGQYLDIELTLDEGQPFGRRKVWTRIMDPFFGDNTKGAQDMGKSQIKRILEAGRWTPNLGPFDAARFSQGGYNLNDYRELNGLRAAIKIKIEKGTGGWKDKNDVADFLSPNPASAVFKTYEALLRGEFGSGGPVTITQPAGPRGPAPSFGFGGQATPASAGFQQPAATGVQPSPTTTFPSNGGGLPATPSWLSQAQGA